MKSSEVKGMSEKELKSTEHDISTEIFKLRLQLKSGSLKNKTLHRMKKRDLARVKTELRSRELGASGK